MTTHTTTEAPEENVLPELNQVLQFTRNPTIVFHNRLEGAPRAEDFSRAQRAEVRDAAFMIGWAYAHGEHYADDAGSLAFAKMSIDTTRLRRYRAGNVAMDVDDTMPLEPLVERRPLPMSQGGLEVSLDIRLLMGRQWLRMLASVGNFEARFVREFPITVGPTPEDSPAEIGAHAEAWCTLAAVQGRRMDGMKLYEFLVANVANPPNHTDQRIPELLPHAAVVRPLEGEFVSWFRRMFYQPQRPDHDAWDSSRLEYRFSAVAPWQSGDQELVADEYYQGRLDWYNLDVNRRPQRRNERALARQSGDIVVTTMPAAVLFEGMPNPRLWSFEDRRVNFGEVSPATTDLAKLLLVEFAMSFSNDWHLIPCDIPLGLAKVRGLVVTTVFGERLWIDRAANRESWQNWGMYDLDTKGDRGGVTEPMLALLPTPVKVQEGRPREEVLLARDEVAGYVFGIEERIALPTGETKPGLEAAREIRAFHEARVARLNPPVPGGMPAADGIPRPEVRYQLINSIAENWIPFVPVHLDGSDAQIKLQRASLLRIVERDPEEPTKIKPRTSILRPGLDGGTQCAYYIHEEEVPRGGIRVKASFQRTRWTDGAVWVWLGMRKLSGRGERSSELAFDQLVPVPK